MQAVSKFLPMTYAFEAMRIVHNTGVIPYDYVALSFAMNVVYLLTAIAFFMFMFKKSKEQGLSTQ